LATGQGPTNGHTTATVGLREAAQLLGISCEGVRKRVLRGQLPATKSADGAWQISLPALDTLKVARDSSPDHRPSNSPDNAPNLSADRLVAALQQQLDRVWDELQQRTAELEAERQSREAELERRAEEMRRKDIMLAEFAHALAELKQRLPELEGPEELLPATPAEPQPVKPSWWRRLLYGPGA
jgi:hypothetical protein